jgi:hypothetical protein
MVDCLRKPVAAGILVQSVACKRAVFGTVFLSTLPLGL